MSIGRRVLAKLRWELKKLVRDPALDNPVTLGRGSYVIGQPKVLFGREHEVRVGNFCGPRVMPCVTVTFAGGSTLVATSAPAASSATLAAVATPGYLQVLSGIHETLYPRSYLEIGVSHGVSLALTLPGTRAIGVDPAPKILSALAEDAILERCTSDDFFDSGRLDEHLQGSFLDLSFIDGMHLWEFALRDFANIERHSHSGSIVLVHDCLPRSAAQAEREQQPGAWTGDVWKLLYYLREERPDLNIAILDSPPTGLGVIQQLNPDSQKVDFASVVDRYMNLDFASFESDIRPSLPIVSGDWAEIRRLLPAQPWQPVGDVSLLVADRGRRRRTRATRMRRLGYSAKGTAPFKAALRWRNKALQRLRLR